MVRARCFVSLAVLFGVPGHGCTQGRDGGPGVTHTFLSPANLRLPLTVDESSVTTSPGEQFKHIETFYVASVWDGSAVKSLASTNTSGTVHAWLVFPEQQLRALHSVLPLSLGAKLIAEVEAEYVKALVSLSAQRDASMPIEPAAVLENVRMQVMHHLGIIGQPRAVTWEELLRLPMPMKRKLKSAWAATQRSELLELGLPLHLFDSNTVPGELRNKFVVADGGVLRWFDSEDSAFTAAKDKILRDLGPFNAAYFAAADEPLPTPHFGEVSESDAAMMLKPVRLSTLDEVMQEARKVHSWAYAEHTQ